MIVQCDKCRTKFRIADERVSDNGVKVRCSRCAHVFVVRKGQDTARLNPAQLMNLAAQTASGGAEAPTSGQAPLDTSPRGFPPPATTEQAALALGFTGDRAETEVLPQPPEAVTVQSRLSAEPDATWGAQPGDGSDGLDLDLESALSGDFPPPDVPTNGVGPQSGVDAPALDPPSFGPASSPRAAPLSPPPPPDDPLAGSPSSLDLGVDTGDRFPPPPEGGFGGPPPPPPPSSDVPSFDPPEFAPPPPPPPPDGGQPRTMTSGGAYRFGGSQDFFEGVDGDIPGLLPPEALGDDDPFGGHEAPPPPPPPPPPEPSDDVPPTPAAPFSDRSGVPLARIDLGKAGIHNLSDGVNVETTAIAAAYEDEPAPVRRELPQVGERTGLWPSLVGALIGVAVVAFALPDIGAGLVDRFSRRGADVLSRVSRARVLSDSLEDVRALDTHVTAYPVRGGRRVLVVRGLARNVGSADLPAPRAVVLAMRGDDVVGRAEAPTGVLLAPDVLSSSEPAGLGAAFDRRAETVTSPTIPPGGERPFMVVFPEPPEGARELLFVTEFLPPAAGS